MINKNNLQHLIFHTILKSVLIACCLCAISSCSSNKYDGTYIGKLIVRTDYLGTDGSISNTTTEDEKELVVSINQTGSDIFVSISGSRLMGECNFKAQLSERNLGPSIEEPQSCSSSVPLSGSISRLRDEITISLSGYSESEKQRFEYTGEKK